MRWARRLAVVAMVVAVGAGLSACQSVLTPEGQPYQVVATAPGSLTVTDPAGNGRHEQPGQIPNGQRDFLWSASPIEADPTVCAQFDNGQGIDQQGIAMRVQVRNGITRGITVMRNIAFYNFGAFNFHVWDTADAVPFTGFAQVVVPTLPYAPAVYPLNMCARILGSLVQFVVWRPGTPQPAWGSTTQGGEGTLPADAPTIGLSGLYVGHMAPGTSDGFSDVTVDGVPQSI